MKKKVLINSYDDMIPTDSNEYGTEKFMLTNESGQMIQDDFDTEEEAEKYANENGMEVTDLFGRKSDYDLPQNWEPDYNAPDQAERQHLAAEYKKLK
jgi:hypothetical protein